MLESRRFQQTSMPDEKQKQLETIAQQITACEKCGLCKERTNTVPGAGSPSADIVFVGEGPGKSEDEQGLPFVGAAGRVLNEMLGRIKLKREDVFITNIVKCRPPGNRDPEIEEKNTCYPYLEKQLEAIDPALVITLGRHSMEYFLPEQKISKVHGQPKIKEWPNGKRQVIYPLYHPAVALYNPRTKTTLLEDFYKIPYLIEQIRKTDLHTI